MGKKRKHTPRATRAETAKRINEVYKLLLRGASRQDIIKFVSDSYGLVENTADKYIADARKIMGARLEVERDTELAQAIERYEMLFSRAFAIQDYKTCLQAQARIDKIMGFEKNTLDVTIAWREEAKGAIKAGEFMFDDVAFAYGEDLASELFREAGVPIDDD